MTTPTWIVERVAPDIVRLAALYTHAIVSNHPFVDGNERVGFVVGILFLELNACTFTAPRALATLAVLDLAAGRTGLDGYERFLRDHARCTDDHRRPPTTAEAS